MSSTQRHSSVLQSLLQSGLTPARLTFSHLIITGIPVLWGIKPLWDSSLHSWMGAKVFNRFSPATSMFNDRILTEGRFASSMEASAVHDMGWLFIYPYELSLVAWFILRNSQQAMEHFHDALALCSFATVLFLSLLQGIHPKWSLAPLEPDFFARMVLCHMVAVSVSAVSIALRKSNPVLSEWQQDWRAKSARWSIPGMALLSGAVVSSLFLVACVQVLVEKQGLANYFDLDSEVSQIFMTSIYMGMYYLAVHAFLLYRLRYNVMDVYQLKHLCFYKFLVNLLVPLFWLPEFDPMVHVDKRVTLGTRLLMATIYWLGYHFAGVGDNVGRILVGEKAD